MNKFLMKAQSLKLIQEIDVAASDSPLRVEEGKSRLYVRTWMLLITADPKMCLVVSLKDGYDLMLWRIWTKLID